jgi:hypothetical protein
MTEQYVQLPTKEEFKQGLAAKFQSGEIGRPQMDALIEQYKADLNTYGPPLSPDQMSAIDAKVTNVRSRFTVPEGVPEDKVIPPGLLDQTRNDLIKAEQFRMTDPEEAAMIDELSPLESFMIGVGGGFDKIFRGLTGRKQSPEDQQTIENLQRARPSAVAGELVGETAPFVPLSVATGGIASIPLRAAAAVPIGAAEGFAIQRGEGGDGGQGALVGAAVAGAFELGIPVVGRMGGALFRKLTGKAPVAPIVDGAGKFSDEFLSTISESGLTPEDFMADVQNVIGGQGNDELANAVADTVTAIKSQSGRDLKAIAASPDIDPKVLASAERLGVAADIPISVMSQNNQFKDLEMGLSSIIGSNTGARLTNSVEIMMDKADETIQLLGGTTKDSGDLSRRVYSNIETTMNGLQSQSDDLYNTLSKAVPPETAVTDIAPLQDYMRGQLRKVAGQADKLDSIDKQLINNLMGSEDKGVIVTYHMIDRERKKIGEQLAKKSTPFPDATQAELTRAYGMLTELQGNVLQTMDASALPGGDAKALIDIWNQGKGLVAQRKQIEEGLIDNFGKNFGTNIIPTLEAGVFKLPKDGTQKFVKAIEAVPPELREEAIATSLNRVFTAGSKQSQLNMGGYSQWWNQLNRNQTAKNELFKHLSKEGQQRLEDLAAVSDGFRKALIHKKDTGRVQSLFEAFDKPNGLLDKLYTGGGGVDPTSSAVAHIVKTAASKEKKDLAHIADRLLAAPEFKQMVVSAMDDPASKQAQSQLRVLTESKVYNAWVDALPKNSRIQLLQTGLIPFLLGGEQEDRNQPEAAE